MPRYRRADGFTLLEVMVALAVLAVVMVVGLEAVGVGAAARARVVEQARVRALAERKMAEIAGLSGAELQALAERAEGAQGGFEPPFDGATWRAEVGEAEAGTGLFRIELRVEWEGATVAVSTYLNRFGELWSRGDT